MSSTDRQQQLKCRHLKQAALKMRWITDQTNITQVDALSVQHQLVKAARDDVIETEMMYGQMVWNAWG